MSDNLSMLDSLPHEILTNVFVRLPIKSIVTCTAVCKTWKSLIQNPTFISNHLHHSSNNNNNKHPLLLFRHCSLENEHYVLHFDNQDFNEYTRFDDFPFQGQSYDGIFLVVGTCNGLIFLADDLYGHHKFFLWNPCVRKFVKLPKPNITCFSHDAFDASVGFGFDSKTDDYKVVRLVTLEEKGQEGKSPPEVEVYSLSTGKWRMLTASPPIGAARGRKPEAFVNGALHWVALTKTGNKFLNFVMVFDLGEEVFREIALPKLSGQNGDEYWVSVSISAYGNSLALFQQGFSINRLRIWVMKDYADASSWTKIISLSDLVFIEGIPRSCIPKGFRKSGEVILEMYGGYLGSRDLKTKEFKDLRIRGYAYTFVDSYVESLVLLDKPNQQRKRQKRKRNNNRKQICGPMLYKIHRFRFFLRCKTQNRSWSKLSKHRKGSNLGGRNS
ncbi:F-box/kelch-repeat protein At3g23880-like isoform X1 [Quercus lobata]|uniref:F-box/kelch-repeat protein At3g23880-like isoform X1 n=1 Tax=Quercus lobata TaxID=97700 RepID=UPI00124873C5|nr:F-box/kelch-repeat protein At3g23880-like isoform X1 [Quercus lobata]